MSLDELNRLAPEDFVARLEGVFEHSPWIARRAAADAPFGSRLQLLQQMRAIMKSAAASEQLALINAHPKLGARGRIRQQLTQESSREQNRAGLDACSDEEYARLQQLNGTYEQKFGFPFILAVRGHDPPAIIAQMQRRLLHDRQQELHAALEEIGLIAGYRLADIVASDAASEARAMLQQLPQASAESLITQWMRAAHLGVCRAEAGQLVGVSSGANDQAATLIMGLHYDADSRSLIDDGGPGCVIGIAVSQQMREQARQLPFNLAVFSQPQDNARFVDGSPAALNVPGGCIGMASVDCEGGESERIVTALRAAGLSECYFLVMSGDGSHHADRASSPPPSQLERAIGALWELLLHTEPATGHKGQSLSHG